MDTLELFMKDNSIIYAVIGNIDGTIWREYGDSMNLDQQGIVSHYLPSPQAVSSLLEMLIGQVCPQTVRQGKVTAILSLLSSDTVAAIFIHDESDVITRKRKAKIIHDDLIKLFRNVELRE